MIIIATVPVWLPVLLWILVAIFIVLSIVLNAIRKLRREAYPELVIVYSTRNGIPFIHGKSDSSRADAEWHALLAVISDVVAFIKASRRVHHVIFVRSCFGISVARCGGEKAWGMAGRKTAAYALAVKLMAGKRFLLRMCGNDSAWMVLGD